MSSVTFTDINMSDEFDTGEERVLESVPDAAQDVLDSLETPDEGLEDDLTEIEKRMEVAAYYNCLLKDSIFGADDSHAARVVTHRIKKFVKQELSELVGLTAPKAAPPAQPMFSEAEIAALKALAAKVLGKGGEEKPVAKGPQLNTVVKPPATTVIPRVPTKPAVKVTAPAAQPPAPAPAQQTQQKQGQKLVKKTQQKPGQTRRKYVEIPHPIIPGETIKKDVAGQAQPVGVKPLPMPSGMAMTAALEAQARQIALNPVIANQDREDVSKIKNQVATAIQLTLKE